MKKTNCIKGLALGFTSLIVFGCGGGGGESNPSVGPAAPPPPPQPYVEEPAPVTDPEPMFVSSGVGTDKAPSHLYTMDPVTGDIATDVGVVQVLSETGVMVEEPAITDLALSWGHDLFGCSYTTLYSIDKTTAVATPVGPNGGIMGVQGVNALAFDKTSNILYGATTSGEIIYIDPETAAAHVLFALPEGYVSSGDLVFSPEGRLYLSIRQPGQNLDDIIAEINLQGNTITFLPERTGAKLLYGLAYFDNVLYGVTAAASGNGSLYKIDLTTGKANLIRELTFSGFGSN